MSDCLSGWNPNVDTLPMKTSGKSGDRTSDLHTQQSEAICVKNRRTC